MNIVQIEKNMQKLFDPFSKENLIYRLLLAYGLPKASITRLQKGNLNLSKVDGEISWKKKVFFKEVFEQDLHVTISTLADGINHDERFVIATDYKTFLAIDTKTRDKLDIELKDLPKHYDFFLPWAGMEKVQYQNENPADVKAAEKMAKLFDEIKNDNPDNSPEFIHGLNVFLCRLLFCSFAEDTNIFKKNQFTNAIASHTQADGSDLSTYLSKLFEVMNTPKEDRQNLPEYLNNFPYVDGGLFREKIQVPIFTRRSRQAIIDNGELDWSVINPDIFGSMMQAVMTPEHRDDSGIHYTSVPNIMKVIEPLFLNNLKETFEKAKGDKKKLNELLHRLETIKIFDPACGSGNFLVIAYKELRKLEMEIYKERRYTMPNSLISISQFYGIELDDFAHEIAQLSLWLAEHQMNVEFFEQFGCTNPTLPLKEAGNIVQGNACRIDWEAICPNKEGDEIYILGNPPYLGTTLQSSEQKSDMEYVFRGNQNYKKQDYISCWFLLAAKYLNKSGNSKYAFVTTNSLCQGTQVELTWPLIFNLGFEIFFTHKDFKWTNSAKDNAGVICSIVGLRKKSDEPRFIYFEGLRNEVKNINAYLVNARNTIVKQQTKPISQIPKMTYGNKPLDGGHFILSEKEKNDLVNSYPESICLIRKFIGSSEYIRGEERWCLWIPDELLSLANSIPSIKERISKVRDVRLKGGNNARNKVNTPHKFEFANEPTTSQIIVPRVSSIRREYIPIGFVDIKTVIADSAQVIFDPEPYIFGIITSRMHMNWVRITAGRLKSDYRYSSYFSYHTFPFPSISDQRKQEITHCVLRILEEREKHPDKTLAQLYDPDKMPKGLLDAHRLNDLAVERCYRSKPFESDEERLDYLFMLYEKMIAKEKEKSNLCEKDQKTQ